MHKLPIASPSCVIPNTVAANALFLANRVQEVGLCFFESTACIEYTEDDLPPSLADLPLKWHVHLPVDLLWGVDNAQNAANTALKVVEKANYLNPRFAVLHPPTNINTNTASKLIFDFARIWFKHTQTPILLENIADAPITNLDAELFNLSNMPIGICLDVGHMLGFNQVEMLLNNKLLKHVQLVHWSAPGKKDEHLPLTYFNNSEYKVVQELVRQLPLNTCHMLEIFNWDGIEQSYPVLKQLLELQP